MTNQERRDSYFAENPNIQSLYEEILELNAANNAIEQGEMLRTIKHYAIMHSPFYKTYSIDNHFPIMNKVDLITHHDEILCPKYANKPLHRMSTSGSTGIPFTVEQNMEKRHRLIAELKAFGLYADYPSHERMIQFRAFNGKELDRSVDERENIWRYDISYLSEDSMPDLLSFIEKYQPRILFGYCSTMDFISTYMIEHNIQLKHQVSSILVGAETLTKEVASRIYKAFGCPIFDRYSNQEMGILAQREYGKTDFLFNVASYHLEIVKLDCDEPCEEGEIGRIVVTDLYNRAFPMIRYDTGDVGSYIMHEGKLYLKELLGRRVDTIYDTLGRVRQPHMITNIMWGVKNIRQWQFIQVDEGEYTINLCTSDVVDEIDIQNRLHQVLGNEARILVEYVDEIPVANSLKRRYIINKMSL